MNYLIANFNTSWYIESTLQFLTTNWTKVCWNIFYIFLTKRSHSYNYSPPVLKGDSHVNFQEFMWYSGREKVIKHAETLAQIPQISIHNLPVFLNFFHVHWMLLWKSQQCFSMGQFNLIFNKTASIVNKKNHRGVTWLSFWPKQSSGATLFFVHRSQFSNSKKM